MSSLLHVSPDLPIKIKSLKNESRYPVVNFSIQRRLILWLLVLALPISAACAITVSLVKSSLTDRVIASLENDHRLETARIESALGQYKRIATALASNRSIRAALSIYSQNAAERALFQPASRSETTVATSGELNTDPLLRSLIDEISSLTQTLYSGVADFRISTLDESVSDQTTGYSWAPADNSIRAKAIKTQQPVFGDSFLNPNGSARLGIVVPVFTDSSAHTSNETISQPIAGLMQIEMMLGPIVDLVEAHEGMGQTSESHIAQRTPKGDAQFITLLRFKRDAAFKVTIARSADKPINWSLESPETHVVREPDYRSVESFLAIGTIADTGWGLVVKIDEAEAFIPLYKVTSLIWKAGVVSLLLLIFSWFTMIRPLATRLQSTAVAADRLATGNYDQLIHDSSLDEIGTVSGSIDQLATDLKADKQLREKAEKSLKYHAEHDALTGLYNRKYLQDVAVSLESSADGPTLSVLFMDLDGFKKVNDYYGHHVGDEILVKFAKELKIVLPKGSFASRWGGDEFVVILPHSDEKHAAMLARRISNRFSRPFKTSQGLMSLGCSIGTCTSTPDLSIADCVRSADEEMYKVKQAFKQENDQSSQAVNFIKTSMKNNRIDIWYQPIVAASGTDKFEVIGAEALLRIKDETGEYLLPSDFLPHIHEHEIAIELDDKVTSLAFEDLRNWQLTELVGPDFYVSVNICGATARMGNLPEFLSEKINHFQIPAANVVVELSEQTQNIKCDMILALKKIGVKIAIDDIGLLNSNLERLASSEADIAKFDRLWLSESCTGSTDDSACKIKKRKRLVLENIASICSRLGMDCVIEGVEHEHQLNMSLEIGINRFQGYLFDHSLSAEQFTRKLENSTPSLWFNTHIHYQLG